MDDRTGLAIAAVIVSFVVVTVATGFVGWFVVVRRLYHRQPALEPSQRPPLPASLADLLLIFLVLGVLQVVGLDVVRSFSDMQLSGKLQELPQREQAALLTIGALSNLLAAVLSAGVLAVRTRLQRSPRTSPDSTHAVDYEGLGLFKTGYLAFAVLAPPVFALQMTLAALWQPTQHPLIKMLEADPNLPIFLAVGLSAVVAAPVFEEYVFRGLLQSWLERAARPDGLDWTEWLFGVRSASESRSELDAKAEGAQAEGAEEPQDDNAQDDTREDDKTERTGSDATEPAKTPPVARPIARWPIVISALLFALMHLGHGPDPIPLFFFALGLGYLYQQTRSLAACMIVHCLLNAFTMALLYLQVFYMSDLS